MAIVVAVTIPVAMAIMAVSTAVIATAAIIVTVAATVGGGDLRAGANGLHSCPGGRTGGSRRGRNRKSAGDGQANNQERMAHFHHFLLLPPSGGETLGALTEVPAFVCSPCQFTTAQVPSG